MTKFTEKQLLDYLKLVKRVRLNDIIKHFDEIGDYFHDDIKDEIFNLYNKKEIKFEKGWCMLNE